MMNNKRAYGAIAGLYEYLMDVDYDGWAEYILSTVKPFLKGKRCVDIGCGSGAFTRRFKRSGLDVIGVDLSDDMLAEAIKLTREEGLNITYVKQDMRTFRPMGKVDLITAVTDCLNYLPQDDLPKVFKKFASALSKGGVLFFDVSSEYKIKNVLGNNMFGEDGEDFTYVWFNRQFDGGVEMDISLFTKTEGEVYFKTEEHHVQYAHTVEQLKGALDLAGFDVVKCEGHLGGALVENSERVNVLAIKR